MSDDATTTHPRRTAVVTGGGSGIGRAAALALAADGWDVVVAGRRAGPLDEVAALAPHIVPIVADVSVEADVRRLFTETVERSGRLDLLFNNAGTGAPATPFDELSLDTWDAVLGVTITGAFLCAREAFRIMRHQDPQGGRIINNGSISAHAPRPLSAPYTVAKHAVAGLTKQLQLDGRPFGIACGQIDIGKAATSMGSGAADGTLQADGTTRAEPTMDVAETGRAVAWMAGLPAGTNVPTLTIMPTAMPFVGRG